MAKEHRVHHYHRHGSIIYSHSIRQRLYAMVLIPLALLILTIGVLRIFYILPAGSVTPLDLKSIIISFLATFLRLLIAYTAALIVALPLAILVTKNVLAERIFLPLFDIFQSIPVLAFFPVLIIIFIHFNLFDAAGIFILFLSMLWNMVFSLVTGLRVIPSEIKDTAHVFHVTGASYIGKILLPSIFPYLITGSLLAWAQGWNIIIVAEVLHTYIPGGTSSQDLFGIGSTLVNASASGQHQIFITAIIVMIVGIALLNFFIWQKLLLYAEKFKFD